MLRTLFSKIRQEMLCLNFPYVIAVIIFANIVVHYPIFTHKFQELWDDQWVVINTYTSTGLTWKNIYRILTEFYHGQYAPLNQLYYSTLYELFGYNPFWFHAFGLIFHVINSILVYTFILELLSLSRDKASLRNKRVSFISALLFSLHPILVESIDWISASKVLIYGLFYLITLLTYVSYLKTGKKIYYVLSFICFILSFAGKEQAVVIPFCLLLIDYMVKRNSAKKIIFLEKIPFIIFAIFFGVVTLNSQLAAGQGALTSKADYSFPIKIVLAAYTFTEYIIKCFIPFKLSYIYPFPMQIGENLPIRFVFYPIAIPIIIACFFDFVKKRSVTFGLVFFAINIAIVLHIISISRFAIVADRYVYIACIGVFFIIAYTIDHFIALKKSSLLVLITLCVYLIYLGVYTNLRSRVWHNTDTLKKEMRDIIKSRNDYQKIRSDLYKHDNAPKN